MDPLSRRVPPISESYQFIVPPETVASKVAVPESHIEDGVVEVIVGVVFTVAVIAVRVGLVQLLVLAST